MMAQSRMHTRMRVPAASPRQQGSSEATDGKDEIRLRQLFSQALTSSSEDIVKPISAAAAAAAVPWSSSEDMDDLDLEYTLGAPSSPAPAPPKGLDQRTGKPGTSTGAKQRTVDAGNGSGASSAAAEDAPEAAARQRRQSSMEASTSGGGRFTTEGRGRGGGWSADPGPARGRGAAQGWSPGHGRGRGRGQDQDPRAQEQLQGPTWRDQGSRNWSDDRQRQVRHGSGGNGRGEGGQQRPALHWERILTKSISSCTHTAQLRQLWEEHRGQLNKVHVAAMINSLAKAWDYQNTRRTPEVLEMLGDLDQAFGACLPEYSTAREVALTVWAWGRLDYKPSEATWQATRKALTALPPGEEAAARGRVGPGAGLDGRQGGEDGSELDGGGAMQRRGGRAGGLAPALMATATPQALAMLSHGLYTLRCRDHDVWSAVEAGCRMHMQQLQPRDLSNILWAHASAGRHDVFFFTELARAVVPRIADLTPHDLAQAVWAMASVSHPYRPLFDAAAHAAVRITHGFSPQGLANMLWGFATVRVPARELFEVAGREALRRLDAFEPRHLTMTAWATARSGHKNPQLLAAISRMAAVNLASYKSKELTLLLWSLAICGHCDDPLFPMAQAAILQRLQQGLLSWQDMAHTLWALSTARRYDQQLYSAVCTACLVDLPGFTGGPAALDTVMQALGHAGHWDPELFQAVSKRLRGAKVAAGGRSGLDALVRVAVGATGGGAGLLGEEEAELMALEADLGLSGALEFAERGGGSSSDPAGVFGSEAQRGTRPGAGVAAGAVAPQQLVLRPSQAANLLASMAALNHRDPQACGAVLAGIRMAIVRSPEEVTTSVLANCLWALAVMDHFDLDFIRLAFQHVREVQRRRDSRPQSSSPSPLPASAGAREEEEEDRQAGGAGEQLLPTHLAVPRIRETMQLLQASLWLSDLGQPEAAEVISQLPQDLLHRAQQAWQKSAAGQSTISLLQREVYQALQQHFGLSPKMEAPTLDGMFSIDMVVQVNGVLLAIEVNGPQHYAQVAEAEEEPPWLAAEVEGAENEEGLRQDQEGNAAEGTALPELQRSVSEMLLRLPQLRALGSKVLRDRFLTSRGYVVVDVPWQEWRQVAGSPRHVKAYLHGLLERATPKGAARTASRAGRGGRGGRAASGGRGRSGQATATTAKGKAAPPRRRRESVPE